VEATFSIRDDGQVDVHLGSEWRLFDEALNDSISSLPPRGAAGNGPSSYWIDQTQHRLREALRTGDTRPFAWGNVTRLRVRGDEVVASLDFDQDGEPGQAIPVSGFISILTEWRTQILDSATNATEPLPETYRRNPFP
jgi:hypothetical protein